VIASERCDVISLGVVPYCRSSCCCLQLSSLRLLVDGLWPLRDLFSVRLNVS